MNRQRRQALSWLTACAGLWLSGCATPPRPRHPPVERDFWSGRLSLQTENDPPQRWSASFELSGHAQEGRLRLLTPFGQTAATALWAPQQARLLRGDDTRTYPDMDTLSAELTGAVLPLAALFDWLRGTATPLAGWEVDLSRWTQGQLRARRTSPLPITHLTLVLDD